MLETEFYELVGHLEEFSYRIPHPNVSFRYDKFIVETSRDVETKLYYYIKKNDVYFKYMSLYPKEGDVGFIIKDIHMDIKDIIDFINTIYKFKNVPRKITINEGYLTDLLIDANVNCPICFNRYDRTELPYIYNCGHHIHERCLENYGRDNKCCICRN